MARPAVKALTCFASLACIFFGARAALASPPVVQAETGCPSVSWSGRAFVDVLRVELKADGIDVQLDGSVQDAPIIGANPDGCVDGAHGATLVFRRGDQRLERHVDLTDVAANARARVLALAAVGLLRDAFAAPPPASAPSPPIEMHLVIEAPPPLPPAPPPATPSPPPPPPPHALTLSLAADARAFPSAPSASFGARASIASPLGRMLVLSVDGAFGRGGARDPLGDLTATLVGGAVGVALAAGPDTLRIHLGPRLEVDWAHVDVTATLPTTTATSADSALVLLSLSATAFVLVSSGVHALVGLDAGATLKGFEARADTRTIGGWVGPLLGLRIGLAWSPGVP